MSNSYIPTTEPNYSIERVRMEFKTPLATETNIEIIISSIGGLDGYKNPVISIIETSNLEASKGHIINKQFYNLLDVITLRDIINILENIPTIEKWMCTYYYLEFFPNNKKLQILDEPITNLIGISGHLRVVLDHHEVSISRKNWR